jgi:hypothetical protein
MPKVIMNIRTTIFRTWLKAIVLKIASSEGDVKVTKSENLLNLLKQKKLLR